MRDDSARWQLILLTPYWPMSESSRVIVYTVYIIYIYYVKKIKNVMGSFYYYVSNICVSPSSLVSLTHPPAILQIRFDFFFKGLSGCVVFFTTDSLSENILHAYSIDWNTHHP